MPWYIKYGMGGGYGGEDNCDWELITAKTKKDAEEWAFELACEDFESSGEFDYEGYAEDNPDADDNEEWVAYCEDSESWIFYLAKEFDTNPND